MAGNFDYLSMFNNGVGADQQNNFSQIGSLGYQPTQSNLLTGDSVGGTIPAVGGAGAGGFNFGNLLNFDNLGSIAQGIGSLGQLYMGGQQLGLARDTFNQTRDAYNQNMANQTKTYNTALEDRIRGRSSNYSGKEEDVQGYLTNNRL